MTDVISFLCVGVAFYFGLTRALRDHSWSRMRRLPGDLKTRLSQRVSGKDQKKGGDLMEQAGRSRQEATQFTLARIQAACAGFGLGLALLLMGLPFYLPLLLMALGYVFPMLRLKKTIQTRRSKILFGLPYYLDILTLALEAGLDLIAAIEELVSRDSPNPLQEEFLITLKSIRMGETRSLAFQNLANRTRVEPLSQLAAFVAQSEELGASLGNLFRLQADSLRQELFRMAEEKAQKAPVKMLLPLIGLIFPVIFFLLFVPIALRMLSSF